MDSFPAVLLCHYTFDGAMIRGRRGFCLIWTLSLNVVSALKVGISLSQSLSQHLAASDADVMGWLILKNIDLQLEFTIMDDGGNFSRAMENYAVMTADPSVDLLFGPCLGTWNAYAANVVTAGNKVLVQWSITYQRYLGGYRRPE
eukprot:s1116_g14.t1